MGAFERPFCSGASCRRISYGPDCTGEYTPKKSRRRIERRQWMREYEVDEADFWQLRHNTGWFFHGPWAWCLEERYGEAYNEQYAEFGVTPSGFPVRHGP